MEQETKTETKKSSAWEGCGCFIAVFLLLAIILGVCFHLVNVYNTSPDQKLFKRAATKADVTIESNSSGLLGYKIVLVPKVDIDDLEVTLKFYTEDRELIKSIPLRFGNVKEGEQYQQEFGATDFTFSELFVLSYFTYEVTGGTVSYWR